MKLNLRSQSIIFLIIAALAIYSCTPKSPAGSSSALPEGNPAKLGVSEAEQARIDSLLEDAMAKKQIPGAVALIARNGRVIYHKAVGTADPETGRPYRTDDIFRLASQSKAIVSTAIMLLWEEGKFKLGDPVSKYIPEFKDPKVLVNYEESDGSYTTRPAESEPTIRQMLTHTAGIGYGNPQENADLASIYQKAGIAGSFTIESVTIGDDIKKLAVLPLFDDPGKEYRYSYGIDVIGYLIEVISGMPLDRFLKERMFDPLGMEDTWFYLPESKWERLVPIQTKENDEWIKVGAQDGRDPDYPIKGKTYFSGGGGLSGTASDYAIFLQMFLNGGEYNGVRLLEQGTVDLILQNHSGNLMAAKHAGEYHALAFAVLNEEGEENGGRGNAGTFRWGGYFNTQYFVDPETQIFGIILKQTMNSGPDPTRWKFRALVHEAVED